jgi:hypothetical protein
MRHQQSALIRDTGSGRGVSILNHFEDILADLYARVCRVTDIGHIQRISNGPYEEMMREFIAASCDTSVPVEQAEHVLVGLGARPRLMPGSLS